MQKRSVFIGILGKLLDRFRYAIVPRSVVYDWQHEIPSSDRKQVILPEGARSYLLADNPVLRSYQEHYAACDYPSGDVLLWTDDRITGDDILYFRGHNAYLYQVGKFNRNLFGYLLAYYYTKSVDHLGLLDRLVEDNSFGVITYQIDGRVVSRDLLDSILEINFLERNLNISQWQKLNVLDIGAGYGRLAYRMAQALPNLISYSCADAVPVSSFIAEYYLQFRNITDKARVVPLDTIRTDLAPGMIDLAVAIHSLSECSLVAIEWWLKLLGDLKVPSLVISPNSGPKMQTNEKRDFSHLLEKYGYQRTALEPKYQEPLVQQYALNPDYYHLYKLK